MQLATFIMSAASLAVSATTLVVILVGAKRAQSMVTQVKLEAQVKKEKIQRALADL